MRKVSLNPGHKFSKLTFYGSHAPDGRTCLGEQADFMCRAIGQSQAFDALSCDGLSWAGGECGGYELAVVSKSDAARVCNCEQIAGAGDDYRIRACYQPGRAYWGGVATTSCTPPNQYIGVTCQ
jgi:hypothetical protein